MLALVCSGCNGRDASTQTIDIGVIAPLTGEAASYGHAVKQGLDFAAAEINAEGGVLGRDIKLYYEDCPLDNKEAVSIMRKMVFADQYDIIIVGHGSGPTTAIAPIAEETETLLIATLASTPQLSDMGDYVFRTIPSDAYQGKELARIVEETGSDTAAILYANDAYGTGIRDVFKDNYGGEIVAQEAFTNGDTDFRTQLTKIKVKEPEAILLVVRNELPNVLNQIETLGIDSVLIGSETTKNQELIDASGGSAEGFYAVFFADTTDYAGYRDAFMTKYGKDPAGYSDYSYDALHVLAETMAISGTLSPTDIKEELYNIRFHGATGVIDFDENGDVIDKPFDLYQVRNGEFVVVQS